MLYTYAIGFSRGFLTLSLLVTATFDGLSKAREKQRLLTSIEGTLS